MPNFFKRLLERPMVKRLLAFAAAFARVVTGVAIRVVRTVTQGSQARAWRIKLRLEAVSARGLDRARTATEANLQAARHDRLLGSRTLNTFSHADTDPVAA